MNLSDQMLGQGNFFFRYRSYFPLILIPLALYAIYDNIYLYPQWFDHTHINWPEILCLILCFTGLMIRVITVGFTPANTSGRNTTAQLADTLNTKGIYSIVRHPLYLGNYFMWLGIAVLTAHLYFIIIFTLLYFLFYERIMLAEESFLSNKFGAQFNKWSEQTSTVVPAFGKWQNADLSFSWKKVLAKEKNGVLAVFVFIAVFQLWCDLLTTGSLQMPHSWTLICLAFTGVLYIILKFLKYKTALLSEANR